MIELEQQELTVQQESIKNPLDIRLPMVEIFETVEGEGTRAGFPTVFIRLFGCNLRCTWCDTKYSYPPAEAEFVMTIGEIVQEAAKYKAKHICFTGGEPLLYGDKSAALIEALVAAGRYTDLHVETNGAVDLAPFLERIDSPVVRYVMDYKLPDSGEQEKMLTGNLALLRPQDELKFVIGSERDFFTAVQVLKDYPTKALPLFSPVWETMPPVKLVGLMLEHGLSHVKLNMQLHKIIWDPAERGV
ncbi:7-carboxy-7-deazaguanine synthase QueE [Paenibacillus mucilaginosus]|uniref:7-carboxy-7-deazaguanine synthase n=3 Tax=Paenibacillus mucilaginosus TaxID=61624 RepID=H6NA13_9BACL|nr:radical SAM protein [Paenibacillus mucilaginosus]AEI40212.1 Radical SAM domain protein [Paenibacillus mucilaginosus KNP414]AFC28857.1 Radical SAM domain-containing protein [Paenibacillus mucilaginosus 3016]AFH61033.1 radical SAM protein [Paenibacillus mucilaginosus K02]MCG7213415.1 radical SAM protein [Paenibacillus mucilaginosus]WDM29438.1 radical SAM protein [Paenibacillus mucilaginosus]